MKSKSLHYSRHFGILNTMSLPKNKKQAEEYKRRLSKSLSRRKFSEEHKINLRKSYYQRHPEKALESQKKYRNGKSREKYLENTRKYNRKYYQMTKEEKKEYNRKRWKEAYQINMEERAGRLRPKTCEVCGKSGRICFDHDHKTGKFRGWLCVGCNTFLGRIDDNKEVLKKLISYLD